MREFLATILGLRYLVVVLAAVLLVAGVAQLRSMPVDVLPEFALPTIEIQTEAVGLSALEVEQLITVPLEQNLINGVAWLDRVRSESVSGLSSVTLLFLPGTDLYRARQMVAERLAQGVPTLPRVSKGPVMLQPRSATPRLLVIRLSSKTLSAVQMSVLARWTITPRLMGVPGVANVATWGLKDRQLQVQVDPDRLAAYQISLLQVIESVGNALWVSTLSFVEASTPGNAGFIDTPQQRLGIQHITPIVSAESLSKAFVQGTGSLLIAEGKVDLSALPKQGGAVRVGDVAQVVEGPPPLIGDALAGEGANLLLLVEKAPGSDTLRVTQGVEQALAALHPGLGDIECDTRLLRQATFLEAARRNVSRAALIAWLTLAAALGLLFLDWRAALIGLVGVPLPLLSALIVLHACGATLNAMVLTGLVVALGVIASDAILAAQAGAVLEATLRARGAMLFATLVCLIAVVPCLLTDTSAGSLLRPLAGSYALAVLASTLLALVVMPALCVILGPARPESPFLSALRFRHENLVRRTVSRPGLAYLAIALLATLGLGMAPFLRSRLLPEFGERSLLVRIDAAPGTSHPAMVRLVDGLLGSLRSLPGVEGVAALVGRAELGDRIVGVGSAEVLVDLKQASDRADTVAAIRAVADAQPGVRSEVESYLAQVGKHIVPEAGASITVRLYGQDWGVLRGKADALREGISRIAGVRSAELELPVEEPTLEVEVDLGAAASHGVNPGQVRRAASALVNGMQVGSLFQEQKVFDVVVWSTPRTRASLKDVEDLQIDTPFRVPVRLRDVAKLRVQPRPSVIRHDDVSRYLDLAVDVQGRSPGAVADEIRARLRQERFPLEYHATVFDAHEAQRSARNRLLAFVAIALIGIVLLFQAAYDSWRLAAVSLLTLPLALVGGLVALVAAAPQVSLGAVFGLLAVFGIAARDQILMVRGTTRLGLSGAGDAFTSIATNALVLGVALVPLLLAGNVPGFEILRPTALVIVGGLVTSTLVDLVVVPVLCLRSPGPDPAKGKR
jgi:Cu/Ag efflux pump CusA